MNEIVIIKVIAFLVGYIFCIAMLLVYIAFSNKTLVHTEELKQLRLMAEQCRKQVGK